MVAKSQIKLIKSLRQKKYRNQHGLFVAEGIKLVRELLQSHFGVYRIFVTDVSVLEGYDGSGFKGAKNLEGYIDTVESVSETELRKLSGLTTPNTVLGVFKIPEVGDFDFSDWILALDDVRDPGNLGTIIRLCDWFGIGHLVCSTKTVDCYNPKVLQASMGSIARVRIGYTDLAGFLGKAELPVYGAFMDGESVYTTKTPEKGILVLGNEARGISPEVEAFVDMRISIPKPGGRKERFGKQTAESLNVATASAILLSEIRRG
ncbi:MAG TPA: RNA methyltransferase [Pricia sp.]|nr:RNA methyltransferase [Pricia sp.]